MTKEEVEAEFLKRGIRVNINGCGCCGSPLVTIEIDGKEVFDEEFDESLFEMITKEQTNATK